MVKGEKKMSAEIQKILKKYELTPERAYELSEGMKKARKQREGLPLFGNGSIGNFVGGAGSSFLRGLGDTAGFLNLDSVDNALNSAADSIEEYLPPAKQAGFNWATKLLIKI